MIPLRGFKLRQSGFGDEMEVCPISVSRLMNALSEFVRTWCKSLGLTQPELAEKAGTGLRFICDI